jgi:hypothetical protein
MKDGLAHRLLFAQQQEIETTTLEQLITTHGEMPVITDS